MDPIANTAYLCCGARAADARSGVPLCGDHLAERFMSAEAWRVFERFEHFRGPNATFAGRHRMIDDLLRERLAADRDVCVVMIGAGFDTRPFRLSGGQWIEVDARDIIQRKEAVLPAADAPNPLTRVPIDFSVESLAEKLAPWQGRSAVVVLEGVSMYLTTLAWDATLGALRRTFASHTVICDLMTRRFGRFYAGDTRRCVKSLGGSFAPLADDPAAVFRRAGYRERSTASIPGFTFERGTRWVPKGWTPERLLSTLLRSLREGYRLHVFETASARAG